MKHVDVYLSHREEDRPGFARVYPPAVAVDGTDAEIEFHNCTADKMTVTLEVPVAGENPFDVDPGTSKRTKVLVGSVPDKGESRYTVYCKESGERARGLSHPIIIIR